VWQRENPQRNFLAIMAAEQQLKDKKKNRFRERFLLTQAASLDEVVTPSAGILDLYLNT
jgi:hypothetical protein